MKCLIRFPQSMLLVPFYSIYKKKKREQNLFLVNFELSFHWRQTGLIEPTRSYISLLMDRSSLFFLFLPNITQPYQSTIKVSAANQSSRISLLEFVCLCKILHVSSVFCFYSSLVKRSYDEQQSRRDAAPNLEVVHYFDKVAAFWFFEGIRSWTSGSYVWVFHPWIRALLSTTSYSSSELGTEDFFPPMFLCFLTFLVNFLLQSSHVANKRHGIIYDVVQYCLFIY